VNDEGRLHSAPATSLNQAPQGYRGARRPPELHLTMGLEDLPTVRLVAETLEDEIRLRRWLRSTAAKRRLFDALLDGLDDLAA